MREQAVSLGWKQLVREPTRGKRKFYFCSYKCAERIRKCSSTGFRPQEYSIPSLMRSARNQFIREREVWFYGSADWCKLQDKLSCEDWASASDLHPDEGVIFLNKAIQAAMEESICRRTVKEKQSTLPWLNERVLRAVQDKISAVIPAAQSASAMRCSQVIREENQSWIAQQRQGLLALPRGSKAW